MRFAQACNQARREALTPVPVAPSDPANVVDDTARASSVTSFIAQTAVPVPEQSAVPDAPQPSAEVLQQLQQQQEPLSQSTPPAPQPSAPQPAAPQPPPPQQPSTEAAAAAAPSQPINFRGTISLKAKVSPAGDAGLQAHSFR